MRWLIEEVFVKGLSASQVPDSEILVIPLLEWLLYIKIVSTDHQGFSPEFRNIDPIFDRFRVFGQTSFVEFMLSQFASKMALCRRPDCALLRTNWTT